MEGLKPFLQSDIAPLFCGMLIFVGIVDLIISTVIFAKKAKMLEATINPTMSPEQKKPIEMQVQTQKMVVMAMRLAGVIFIAMGILGLTYKF